MSVCCYVYLLLCLSVLCLPAVMLVVAMPVRLLRLFAVFSALYNVYNN